MDPIRSYLKDIKSLPLLTAKEEIDLANRIKRGDRRAKRKMILGNLRLVINIAKRYAHLGVPLLDLIEADGIPIVLVRTTEYRLGRSVTGPGGVKITSLAAARGIPFLDYADPDPWDPNTDSQLFAHWCHLNGRGAALFSAELNRDLSSLLTTALPGFSTRPDMVDK